MPANHTTSPAEAGKAKAVEGELKRSSEVLRLILPAAAGSFIELYEFGIYTYMSADITGNFFANGHGGSLGTWAGFATTFIVRPFGGAFFGWLADRFGRKPAMQLTIGIMLVTTVLQGMLPTFHCCSEGWGWFGLVSLILLRVLQGLSVGGELPTACVYITEVSQPSRLGVNLSWISLTGVFGAWSVASFIVFLFQTALTKDQMLLWGWRLPYLLTIIPGGAVIMARRHLHETPAFEDLVQVKVDETQTNQSLEEARSEETVAEKKSRTVQGLWRNYKLAMLVGALGTATFGVTSFVPPVYGAQFIQQDSGLPANVVTFSEMMNYGIPALLAPVVGLLVDRWGAGRTYTLSCLVGGPIAAPFVLYWWAHIPDGQAILSMYVGQAILGLCLALQTSVFVWVVELFPVHVRVTGVSVAYNFGVGVCGGLGPLISDAGNRVINYKGQVSAPATYTIFFGIISLLACLSSRVLAKWGWMRVTHIREAPY